MKMMHKKDKEGTEFEKALYKSLEEMKEEFKVVKNALDLEKSKNKEQTARIEKLTAQVERINTDLHLKPHSGRGDSTRQLARDAFNQSTVSANWEGLEEHPMMENIYLAIKAVRKDLGSRIHDTERRLDNNPPAREVFKELRSSKVILEINDSLQRKHSDIEALRNEVATDRTNANNQDHRLIDRIADIQTAQDALEFIQSETILKHDAAFMFLMGAWAKSGAEPVAEGLRIMLKKPKEKKKQ